MHATNALPHIHRHTPNSMYIGTSFIWHHNIIAWLMLLFLTKIHKALSRFHFLSFFLSFGLKWKWKKFLTEKRHANTHTYSIPFHSFLRSVGRLFCLNHTLTYTHKHTNLLAYTSIIIQNEWSRANERIHIHIYL